VAEEKHKGARKVLLRGTSTLWKGAVFHSYEKKKFKKGTNGNLSRRVRLGLYRKGTKKFRSGGKKFGLESKKDSGVR